MKPQGICVPRYNYTAHTKTAARSLARKRKSPRYRTIIIPAILLRCSAFLVTVKSSVLVQRLRVCSIRIQVSPPHLPPRSRACNNRAVLLFLVLVPRSLVRWVRCVYLPE